VWSSSKSSSQEGSLFSPPPHQSSDEPQNASITKRSWWSRSRFRPRQDVSLLSVRKILFIPHILSDQEKWVIGALLLIFLISGLGLITKGYLSITKAVHGIGGTLSEGILKQPRTINPIYATSDSDRDISRLVFGRLLSYNEKGEIFPDLAEKYEISQDAKTYTVVLRDKLVWHDGVKLNADDVIFTIRTIQNPQFKSPLRTNWQGVTIEKIDDRTVRFALRTPYAPFVENLAIGIIPKHLWETVTPEQALLHELNLKPIGSGPFRFDKLKQNKDGQIEWYQLARNANYYREGPYLSTVVFYFFETEDEMIAAWHKNNIDSMGPISAKHLQEFSQEKVSSFKLTMPRIFGIFFNPKKSPILANKDIRTAIAHALNKTEMADMIALGAAFPVDSMLPPATAGYTPNVPTYAYDAELSKQILAKAGWSDLNGDGILDQKVKENKKEVIKSLRFTLTTSDWPDLVKTAQIIKDSLRGIGIDVQIESKPFSELETLNLRPRNFDILLFGQVYGYEPDPFAFWHSSQIKDPGVNVSFYANKKVDQILEETRKLADRNSRSQKYEEVQKIIANDLPAIFLYSQLYPYVLPTKIRDVSLDKIAVPADRFNNINTWYRNTKRVLK